jgi:hypothetical protein
MLFHRTSFAAMALTAGLWATTAPAQLIDLGKYPDWSGQWNRAPDGGGPRYDPSKPLNAQGAPLKPDYQALHEASLRDKAAGGFGLDTHYRCMPMGVPRQMSGVSLMELCRGQRLRHHQQAGYFVGSDGLLMPQKKDQLPPDLRHFKQREALNP